MKNKYKFVVIILVYCNDVDLDECIQSVYKHIANCKIVVVNAYYDDLTRNNIKKIAEKYNCDFLDEKNKGYSFGNNKGITFANEKYEYEYIIISNPDIIVKQFNDNLPDAEIIAPKVVTMSGKNQNPMAIKENRLAEYLVYQGLKKNEKIIFAAGLVIKKISDKVALLFRKKNIPLVFVFSSALTLYALFFLSFVLRIGSGEQNISKVISTKLMIYAFGHIQGFDIWFAEYAFELEDYGILKHTFLAISSKLGLSIKNQGVYGLISGSCTNVYTQFRSLIEDLGPVFAMIMLVIIFLIVYLLFYKLIYGKHTCVIEQTMFAANFFWLIYFIVSAWTYTTYLLTFVVFGLFLYISFHVKFVWGNRK